MITITLASADDANWIAEMPQLAGNGHRVEVVGATIELTDDALGVLAELDNEHDGYYDGTHVWVGGTEYAVNRSRAGA